MKFCNFIKTSSIRPASGHFGFAEFQKHKNRDNVMAGPIEPYMLGNQSVSDHIIREIGSHEPYAFFFKWLDPTINSLELSAK